MTNFLIYRKCEIINGYYFKILNLWLFVLQILKLLSPQPLPRLIFRMVSHSTYHSVYIFYYHYFQTTEFLEVWHSLWMFSPVLCLIHSVLDAYNLIHYVFSSSLLLLSVPMKRKSITRMIFMLPWAVKSDVCGEQGWILFLPHFLGSIILHYTYTAICHCRVGQEYYSSWP